MRLPRRVPWASLTELDQVCAWIYTDEHDLYAKALAINRLSAWKVITPLPHALESTLAFLVVLQQDRSADKLSSNYLSLRHSYAAVIIRLVNGLVDPLQMGAYARSIASIANQLGIPAWLVELRHAATHEDLPSLEVLREAARQSMSWLLHNYFLPTLNPASAPQREAPPLRPLEPLLKQYKSVLKTITRDVSLRTRYKQEVNTIMRDIERWIAEAKVAANIIIGEVGWDTGVGSLREHQEMNSHDSVESKEKWALERFCDALLEKGGLVPLSKKKRVFPEDKFWPPPLSVSLWKPLLQHVQYLHVNFAYILCTRIISFLLSPDTVSGSENALGTKTKSDPSYNMCIARWVMWILDVWSTSSSDSSEESDPELRKDVVVLLMQGLGHQMDDLHFKDRRAVNSLLQALSLRNPEYSAAAELVSKPSNKFLLKEWMDQDLSIMTDRLTQFRSFNATKPSFSIPCANIASQSDSCSDAVEVESSAELPSGWQTVDPVHWKPCPIGVFWRV